MSVGLSDTLSVCLFMFYILWLICLSDTVCLDIRYLSGIIYILCLNIIYLFDILCLISCVCVTLMFVGYYTNPSDVSIDTSGFCVMVVM